jgi:hypothetical protein
MFDMAATVVPFNYSLSHFVFQYIEKYVLPLKCKKWVSPGHTKSNDWRQELMKVYRQEQEIVQTYQW